MIRRRIAALALGCAVLAAAGSAAAERIRDFQAEIFVDREGRLRVEERIVYDFEDARRHGIYRDIPVRYRRPIGSYHVRLDAIHVSDGDDRELTTQVTRSGDNVRIRIGDADRTVTGVHEYRIAYRVRRGLLFFPDHDELYWNVTGTEWPVPIERASARVYLPDGSDAAAVRLGCFTGAFGSSESACGFESGPARIDATTTRRLGAREGLSLVVGMPKGWVREPTTLERIAARIGDSGVLWALAPLATFVGMLRLWYTRGRDPGPRDAIPVRYEPPDELSPAEVGVVIDERADLSDVTATILDLAVRGYLVIEELEGSRFLFLSDRDYRLHRTRQGVEGLKPHEERMLADLFASGADVRVSELKNHFYSKLPRIKEELYAALTGPGGYFPTSPESVKQGWAVAGIAVGVLGVLGMGTRILEAPAGVAVLLCGVLVLAFSRFMPRRTRKGRAAYEEILGFQEFVKRVDADRLERMGGRSAERFERVLPFAVVLGVADAWADAFADVYTQPPGWYVGSRPGATFHPRSFVSDVGRGLGTIGSSLASQPRGSGSSGFSSGGGFSGGGFGGGGGGSW